MKMIFALFFAIVASFNIYGQTGITGEPVCLFRPETVVTRNPLQRQVIVYGSAYGYLQPVDAVRYIQFLSEQNLEFWKYEKATAAIQYSLSNSSVTGGLSIQKWTSGPNITIGTLVKMYLLTANQQQSTYLGELLQNISDSPFNDHCNPEKVKNAGN